MTISIVIPCRNEVRHIREFLDSVLAQELEPGCQLEIVVADGQSDDGTREELRQFAARTPNIRIIDNPARIVSTGLNAAIAAAYYLRIVAVMYFQSEKQPVVPAGGRTARFAAVLCAVLVVAVGAWPGHVLDIAIRSESTLRPQLHTVQSPPSEPPHLVQTRLPQ